MRGRVGAVIALVVPSLIIAGATGWGALVLFYLAPGAVRVRETLAWSNRFTGRIHKMTIEVK